jgi:hypothetical protein
MKPTRWVRFLVANAVAAATLLGGAMAADHAGTDISSRDLRCEAVRHARGRAICRRLQQEMQWTWTGHAIISPGWRVTFQTVRHTYCIEKVDVRDIAALESMQRSAKDWRAEDGAEFLLRLVRNKDGSGREDLASIFNPRNSSYILKDGCRP